jgi:hypothetical protein
MTSLNDDNKDRHDETKEMDGEEVLHDTELAAHVEPTDEREQDDEDDTKKETSNEENGKRRVHMKVAADAPWKERIWEGTCDSYGEQNICSHFFQNTHDTME